MLSKLKPECLEGFTTKLKGMFKDMELSRDINIAFRQYVVNHDREFTNIDLIVTILTMYYWPTYPLTEVTMPPQLVRPLQVSKKFYLANHRGRKLQWQPALGECVLKVRFDHGPKYILVSPFQAIVFFYFLRTKMSLVLRKASCNIEDRELPRALQSLALGNARVLKKIPKGGEVEDKDHFQFNNKYNNTFLKIKIYQIRPKETTEEKKATEEQVFQDRRYHIDSAIVRIMKMRKILSHNLLITELFNQLAFPVKLADLKNRIESLIDRYYMERDKDNLSQYNYVP